VKVFMLRVYAVLTLIAVRLRWRWVTAKGSSLPTFSKTSPRKLPGLFESWSLCGVSIVLSECTRRASAFPQLACGHINTYIIGNQQIPERDFKLRILGIGDFDKERLSPGRVGFCVAVLPAWSVVTLYCLPVSGPCHSQRAAEAGGAGSRIYESRHAAYV